MTDQPTPLHRADRQNSAVAWLTFAATENLKRNLNDLPELVDQLRRHYPDLLGAGERNPDDPKVRYPAKLAVVDLADGRAKGGTNDPAGEADLARRIGARRWGVLQTLASWVVLADGEMWDDDHQHHPPADTPTVTTEAGWLVRHLEWISMQQWSTEMADDIAGMVRDLETIVGPAYARPLSDRDVLATATELADILRAPSGTIRSWIARGRLQQAHNHTSGRPLVTERGLALYYVVEAQAVAAQGRREARRRAARRARGS